MQQQVKYILSVLFAENEKWLDSIVENFNLFCGPDVGLLINAKQPIAARTISSRIIVVNEQLTRASKWGHYLLAGHVENVKHAAHFFPDHEFFIPIASNCLFIRRFDADLIFAEISKSKPRDINTGVRVDEPPNKWHWHRFSTFDNLFQFQAYLAEHGLSRLTNGQIEGLASTRLNWEIISSIYSGLPTSCQLDSLKAPLEEILPISIITFLGKGDYAYICMVLWPNSGYNLTGETNVGLREIIDHQRLPDHVCSMKWFERANTLQSILLTTTHGNLILDDLRRLFYCSSSSQSKLLNALAAPYLSSQLYSEVPSQDLFSVSTNGCVSIHYQPDRCIYEATSAPQRSYIYTENIPGTPKQRLSISCEGTLAIDNHDVDQDLSPCIASDDVVIAFLYIATNLPDCIRHVEVNGQFKSALMDLTSSKLCMVKKDQTYSKIRFDYKACSGGYFHIRFTLSPGITHLGIPIYRNSAWNITSSMVPLSRES